MVIPVPPGSINTFHASFPPAARKPCRFRPPVCGDLWRYRQGRAPLDGTPDTTMVSPRSHRPTTHQLLRIGRDLQELAAVETAVLRSLTCNWTASAWRRRLPTTGGRPEGRIQWPKRPHPPPTHPRPYRPASRPQQQTQDRARHGGRPATKSRVHRPEQGSRDRRTRRQQEDTDGTRSHPRRLARPADTTRPARESTGRRALRLAGSIKARISSITSS